jgi:hypothetical protein
MAKLKVKLRGNNPGNDRYVNEINGENYREIALILADLKNLNLPIDKAIKEFKSPKNDWDAALGI